MLSLLVASGGTAHAAVAESALAAELRRQLDAEAASERATLQGEPVRSLADVRAFYEARDYRAAWFGDGGLSPSARSLLPVLLDTTAEGLRPRDYHAPFLEAAVTDPPSAPDRRATLDILLTDGFLLCARQFARGRLDPNTAGIAWSIDRPRVDFPALLERTLRSGAIGDALRALLPADPAYGRLRAALARYRAVAAGGGWTALAGGATLRIGSRDARVAALRQRLAREQATPPPGAEPEVFDEPLARAVAEFQRLHGLDPDGAVGPATLADLNRDVGQRIAQIVANLERWRWLPVMLSPRRIVVNIAAFRLELMEEDRTVLSMRAIVGQPYRQTPIFTAPMTYLVLNPYWNIPDRIAREEILPRARRGPGFLARDGIKIFRGWSESARPISPWRIAWQRLSTKRFPYRLRQDPGPDNALGRIKFVLPNPFDVYLHDTPARALFERVSRPFSHGCVRLEHPIELALRLLSADESWTRQRLETALRDAVDEAVRLPQPIPVYFLYWTAWADADGGVSFRADIYGRDVALTRMLAKD